MNEFRSFIVREMHARDWNQRTLAARAGLSEKLISQLVRDERPQIKEMPKRSTLEGLARAFGMTPDAVAQIAAQARGVPIAGPVRVPSVAGVSDADLLRELGARLERATLPPALDLSQMAEDKAPRQIGRFLGELRRMAEQNVAEGSPSLARVQTYFADMLEAALAAQIAPNDQEVQSADHAPK